MNYTVLPMRDLSLACVVLQSAGPDKNHGSREITSPFPSGIPELIGDLSKNLIQTLKMMSVLEPEERCTRYQISPLRSR